MIDAADTLLLLRAIELAESGVFSVTANPRVGCVLVKGEQLLGEGFHQRGGDAHAEVNALKDARQRHDAASIAGATAYVSLEPCCHASRTPACTAALIDAGVARVVVAMLDPHPKVSGDGVNLLRAAGVQVDVAELPEAQRLNYGHSLRMLDARPFVRIKVAQSLDGRTAMASGESKWITGPLARRDVQYWRARSGAIITGRGTVDADDPALNVRESQLSAVIDGASMLRQPLRVVLDTDGQADPGARIFSDGGATLWVQGDNDQASAGASTTRQGALPAEAAVERLVVPRWPAGGRVDINAVLAELAQRGCNEVLVEAGAALVGEFLRRDIWDEILVYSAPKLLGSDARPTAQLPLSSMQDAIEAKLAAVDQVGDDVRTRLVRPNRDLTGFDCTPLGVPDGFLTTISNSADTRAKK